MEINMYKDKRNFTLIELLVVMAILALLASLLMPSLKTAREKAKSAVCLSNQKQIGVGFAHFTTDKSGKMPAWAEANNEATFVAYGNPSIMWDENIAPYLSIEIQNPERGSAIPKNEITGNLNIFSCPVDEVTRTSDDYHPSSYGYNRSGLGFFDSLHIGAIDSPSKLITTGDIAIDTRYFGYATNSEVRPTKQRLTYLGMHLLNNAKEKYNYLFADGHVQNISLHSTLGQGTINSPQGLWTANPND